MVKFENSNISVIKRLLSSYGPIEVDSWDEEFRDNCNFQRFA